MPDPSRLEIAKPRVYQTEVATMEEPLTRICADLAPNFRSGVYGLIIGDDTSGRLPTLAIRAVSAKIAQAEGVSSPHTVFLQAGRYIERDKEVEKQIADRVLTQEHIFDKKVLLVTDYIKTGKTLRRLVGLLSSSGIAFDVASVAVHQDLDISNLSLPEGTTLYDGGRVDDFPAVFNKEELTGIRRHFMMGKIQLNRDYRQPQSPLVGPAREDVALLADRVFSKVQAASLQKAA